METPANPKNFIYLCYVRKMNFLRIICLLSLPLFIKGQNLKMLTWKDIVYFAENGNPEPDRRVEKSDEEWRKLLTEEQYRITRKKGTEAPGSGSLCKVYAPGKYRCVCCGNLLFDSSEKFESGTGWPSFTQPIKKNAIKYVKDTSYGMERIEVLCNVCDAHLGHVFPDGPPPQGLRYCINSASMELVKEE